MVTLKDVENTNKYAEQLRRKIQQEQEQKEIFYQEFSEVTK